MSNAKPTLFTLSSTWFAPVRKSNVHACTTQPLLNISVQALPLTFFTGAVSHLFSLKVALSKNLRFNLLPHLASHSLQAAASPSWCGTQIPTFNYFLSYFFPSFKPFLLNNNNCRLWISIIFNYLFALSFTMIIITVVICIQLICFVLLHRLMWGGRRLRFAS